MKLDYSQITDIEIEGIDYKDAPDFVDAYISNASYMGRDATDEELDAMNDDSSFVYECVMERIY